MSTESLIAAKYAGAALALAQEQGKADALLTDLQLASQIFGRGEGRDLLVHPLLAAEKKVAAVQELLQGKVSTLALGLLKLLIEKRRGGLLALVAEAYARQLEQSKNRVEATLSTALPLDATQLEQLRKSLSAMTGKEVDLQQVVDPKLLAGARIAIGDRLLDGTLEGRIAQLRRALLEN